MTASAAAEAVDAGIPAQRFTLAPLHPVLGAEVTGLDLSTPLSEADFGTIRTAFERHSVLVLRDQVIEPEDLIAFSRRLGPLEVHVLQQFLLPGHPEVLVVSNEIRDGRQIGLADAGRYWHSDLSYKAERSRAWDRCCMPRSCRATAAIRSSPACTPSTTRCRPICSAGSRGSAPCMTMRTAMRRSGRRTACGRP